MADVQKEMSIQYNRNKWLYLSLIKMDLVNIDLQTFLEGGSCVIVSSFINLIEVLNVIKKYMANNLLKIWREMTGQHLLEMKSKSKVSFRDIIFKVNMLLFLNFK